MKQTTVKVRMLPGLTRAFEVAFQGCGTTLSAVLASDELQNNLKWAKRNRFTVEQHLRFARRSYRAETDRVTEIIQGVEPLSDSIIQQALGGRSLPESQNVADEKINALIRTLGQHLIKAARRLCLSPDLRVLAAEMSRVHREGSDPHDVIIKVYDALHSYNAPQEPEDEPTTDTNDEWTETLLESATWWVDDRMNQCSDRFLPLGITPQSGRRPNCQGLSLLLCALAEEAQIPNLRVNLLLQGRDLGRSNAHRDLLHILETIDTSGLTPVTVTLVKELKKLCLRDAIARLAEHDFHSSCLMRFGTESYIIDPFASICYKLDDSSADPFKLVTATKLPGANVPVSYVDRNLDIYLDFSRARDLWCEAWNLWLPQLAELAKKEPAEIVAEVQHISLELMKVNVTIRQSKERSEALTEEIHATLGDDINRNIERFSSGAALVTEVVEYFLDLAYSYFGDRETFLNKTLCLFPPNACEYGETTYTVGFTTLQALMVLEGVRPEEYATLAQFGTDQSVLYLLAERYTTFGQALGEPAGFFGALAFDTLFAGSGILTHPATKLYLDRTCPEEE